MAGLEWAPVLKGEIYCSPRCGMNCKKADHDKAHAAAAACCAILGAGWEPRVWENWGWNWSADKAGCSIRRSHPDRDPNYSLMWNLPALRSEGKFASVPQIILSGPDPLELLGLARQDARTFIARIEAELAAVGEGE